MSLKTAIAAVVVIYNVSCGQSDTCRALEQIQEDDFTVIIYDNSTADFGNREYCEEKGWKYLGGQGNVGISRAYNACVDALKDTGSASHVCLFDDDTHVDSAYFSKLKEAIAAGGRIFAPLVYSAGKLLSPCRINKGHITRRFADGDEALTYQGEEITAINSGMAIDLALFSDYRYDENIFLDGVDHTFLMDMRSRGEKLSIFPYRCNHSFSGDEKPSKQSALNRFQIYVKDYKYILRNQKVAYLLLVGKRALRLAAQYRSSIFLSMV